MLTAGGHADYTDSGSAYGVRAGFSTTRWRNLSVNGQYMFESVVPGDDQRSSTTHTLQLGTTVRVSSNMLVDFSGSHSMTDVSSGQGVIQSGKNTADSLQAHVSWVFRRHSFNLSGFISRTDTGSIALENNRNNLYGFTFFYNTILFRNAYYDLHLTYDNNTTMKRKRAMLNSKFTWHYAKLSFSAEYQGEKYSELSTKRTSHKLMVRATRTFSKVLR
jgi:hypothetical protein